MYTQTRYQQKGLDACRKVIETRTWVRKFINVNVYNKLSKVEQKTFKTRNKLCSCQTITK